MASNCPLSIFKRVLLVSAAGDRYVSPHSARIESPKSAFADKVNGTSNILIVETLQKKLEVNKTIVERYHVFHQNLPQGKTRFCSILTGPGQFWPAVVDNWSILVDLNRFWSILVNLGRPQSILAGPGQSWPFLVNLGRPRSFLAGAWALYDRNISDTATKVIGRAAHIAVLDSQVFISAFLIASRAFNSGHGKPVAL